MNTATQTLQARIEQLKELHASGALGDAAYAEARQRLERELVGSVVGKGAAADIAAPRPSRRLTASLGVAVLALAVVGYAITGAPDRAGFGPPPTVAADSAAPVTDAQVAEVIDRLAQRLKENPEDLPGWTLLARAYTAMGRFDDALPAYQKAMTLAGDDANLMADYADTLAAKDGGRFSPEIVKIVDRALAIEPNNIKALALSGSAAFDQRDYAGAVRQWEKAEAALPRDSELLPQVRASIAQARQQAGLPPATAAAPTAPAAPTVAAVAKALSGQVSLAPALAARASPEDTVFIFARPAEGPRMPLAVLRKQVKDLPLSFTLDDSMAMAPTAKISDHARVVVSARISKSGDATPRSGDLGGQAAAVAPGASGIVVTISEVVGP